MIAYKKSSIPVTQDTSKSNLDPNRSKNYDYEAFPQVSIVCFSVDLFTHFN